jgi:oxygen-dependent protoporphyrinogen oxidase
VERGREQLLRILGIASAPESTCVTRWPHALPVFSDRHSEAVAGLEHALAPFPIALCGAAFRGAGIDAAVRSAEAAAARFNRGSS